MDTYGDTLHPHMDKLWAHSPFGIKRQKEEALQSS
jgi:hypothetical protein